MMLSIFNGEFEKIENSCFLTFIYLLCLNCTVYRTKKGICKHMYVLLNTSIYFLAILLIF